MNLDTTIVTLLQWGNQFLHARCMSLVFLLVCLSILVNGQVVNRAEYFIDTDPGPGNATAITIASGSNVNFNFSVPTNSLATGFHNMGVRVRESVTGFWSHAHYTSFYIVPPVISNTATTLTSGEYFFDTDPGAGNGVAINVTPSATVSMAVNGLNISALSPGFHTISFRFRDNLGKWTHALSQSFYIVPPVTFVAASTITGAEYFFDTDAGAGNNTALSVSAGSPLNINPVISVSALAPGFHKLGIRYRDNLNRWSHAEVRSFYIVNADAIMPADIVAAEYYVDTDPGIGSASNIPAIVPGASIDQLLTLDMTGVPVGAHTLNIRVKDSRGFWSYVQTASFTVSSCSPPAVPVASTASRCGEGSLTLSATGATGAQVYRWYDDPVLSNVIATGSSFTTPSLTASKNYYVSVFDPATSCESSRATANAVVTILSKPVINPSGSLSVCEGGSLFLAATTGFSQYVWSDGQATQQILVNAAGNYSVQVGDGTCLSAASDPVIINVIPSPAKPIVTVNGNTTICGTGTVDLSGPTGMEYVWSTGATTQTITISQTGVYYLFVKTPGGCPSLASDPVVVSVLSPPCSGTSNQSPVINNTPLASTIEGVLTIDLATIVSDPDNNLDFSTLSLVNNTTARGASASIDAAYNLIVNYSGMPFTGTDRITLEVCDLAGACVQQVLDIEVVGAVVVYNGVTPDGDGKNDFMLLKYIDVVEGAQQNRVTIFNRWGDVVFEISDYNNDDKVFRGQSNTGADLPSGTYFYKIEFSGQLEPLTGFLTLIL